HGREEVRAYWTRQWAVIDPQVEPLSILQDESCRFIVEVHQVVRDIQGNLLVDTVVHHAYQIRNSLIERMDIE
ncbi:MAG: ketosteroid isomerase, partial [Terracidiphilus sp.]